MTFGINTHRNAVAKRWCAVNWIHAPHRWTLIFLRYWKGCEAPPAIILCELNNRIGSFKKFKDSRKRWSTYVWNEGSSNKKTAISVFYKIKANIRPRLQRWIWYLDDRKFFLSIGGSHFKNDFALIERYFSHEISMA